MSVIKNINYQVGEFSLHIKEWSFPDEGLTLLCGPSGSGKTSLIRILCGLIPSPAEFSWIFKGSDLAKLPPQERHLGVLFQDLRLFPSLSAGENIVFPLKARNQSEKTAKKALYEIAHALDLEQRLHSPPEQLSGGEKQRVALGRALIASPRFLFLDEPFVHMDSKTREKAIFYTFKIIKEKNLPTLLVSHDWKMFEKQADQIHHLPNYDPV